MTAIEQNKRFEDLVFKLKLTLQKKGNDYANDDVLWNFKDSAARIGKTPQDQCISIISQKVSRIANLLVDKSKTPQNESIEDSIKDLLGYTFLLDCILHEKEEEKEHSFLVDKMVDDEAQKRKSFEEFDSSNVFARYYVEPTDDDKLREEIEAMFNIKVANQKLASAEKNMSEAEKEWIGMSTKEEENILQKLVADLFSEDTTGLYQSDGKSIKKVEEPKHKTIDDVERPSKSKYKTVEDMGWEETRKLAADRLEKLEQEYKQAEKDFNRNLSGLFLSGLFSRVSPDRVIATLASLEILRTLHEKLNKKNKINFEGLKREISQLK